MARAALITAAALFLALWSEAARASYEWLPEFLSLTETEQSAFEGPGRFASEYPADILSYLKPADWEYQWLTHPRALDVNLGSTGAAHFAIDQRLKVHAPLNDFLDFRFTYFEEADRERLTEHSILELVFWPTKKIGVSLYGEPEHFKRNNDTGIALMLRPTERHEIRVFNTFIDVTRLKRGDTPDNFIEPDLPYARGIVGRMWSDPESGRRDFFEYAFRQETKTRWRFPVEQYDYEFWRLFGALYGQKTISAGFDLNARIQLDRKYESRSPDSPESPVPFGAIRTDRLRALVRGEIRKFGPNDRWALTPGLEFSTRVWNFTDGQVIHRDLLPHAILRFPAFGSGEAEDYFDVGVVMNWHRVFGPLALYDPQDADARTEWKLNLAYGFSFGKTAKLVLIATGDLDQFFTRHSWDGGSAQFQLLF